MTDNDIKKALECCKNGYCDDCPFKETREHCFALDNLILDLINRLQAENERLITECGNQSTLWSKHFESIFETAKETTKTEAYKEFADRLKYKYSVFHTYGGGFVKMDIDNLLKEMVGE